MATTTNPVREARSRVAAVGVPFLIVSIVVVMVIPLPAAIIDLLLACNIGISVVILVTAMMVSEPLQFSVFPSLLLITTLFRLALNVSTTRLILSGSGSSAIIETFGGFVVGGNLVIGLVIFLILIVIQFAVITTGAGRVAEVGARFMLDAMPGKQMAIDADLNSGLIDEAEARRRRLAVSQEADFYGSMDGASKFVKGDAIASVIIVLVNLLGGFGVGITQLDMGLGEAVNTFSLLTIGDGLVSQIPALLISVASGIIVTRSVSDNDGGFGGDVWGQLLADRRTLGIASAAILVVGLMPGLPKVPFLAIALFLAAMGLRAGGRRQSDEPGRGSASAAKPAPGSGSGADDTIDMRIEALELELAPNLLDLVTPEAGGKLLDRVKSLRRHLARELGLVVPLVRTRDDLTLAASTYVIKVHGVEAGRGTAPPGRVLVLANHAGEDLPGEATVEPVFGLPASWVPEHLGAQMEATGHSVVDRGSVVLTHLSEVVRTRAADLLSRQDVQDLVEGLRPVAPAVADEVGNDGLTLPLLHHVLAALLKEGIPIRDLVRILEAVTAVPPAQRDVDHLTEAARRVLGPAICAQAAPDGTLRAITLDPLLEQQMLESLRPGDNGAFLSLDPRVTEAVLDAVGATITSVESRGTNPVLLCSAQLRPVLRRLLVTSWSSLPVVSYAELAPNLNLESVGVIRVDQNTAAV